MKSAKSSMSDFWELPSKQLRKTSPLQVSSVSSSMTFIDSLVHLMKHAFSEVSATSLWDSLLKNNKGKNWFSFEGNMYHHVRVMSVSNCYWTLINTYIKDILTFNKPSPTSSKGRDNQHQTRTINRIYSSDHNKLFIQARTIESSFSSFSNQSAPWLGAVIFLLLENYSMKFLTLQGLPISWLSTCQKPQHWEDW